MSVCVCVCCSFIKSLFANCLGWAGSESTWIASSGGVFPYAIAMADISSIVTMFPNTTLPTSRDGTTANSNGSAAHRSKRMLRSSAMTMPRSSRVHMPSNHSSHHRHHRKALSLVRAHSSNISGRSNRGIAVSVTSETEAPVPWEWLSGYDGGNGPIMRLVPGTDSYAGGLFIVGASNNRPAVLYWNRNRSRKITSIGPTNQLAGVLTGLFSMVVEVPDGQGTEPPSVRPRSDDDESHPGALHGKTTMFFIVLSLVLCAIALCTGVSIARYFNGANGYTRVPGDDGLEAGGLPYHGSISGLSLGTLTDGSRTGVDLEACYQRAMRARMLPIDGNKLSVIDPKDIVLSRIIGEGSFGRVWSGKFRNNSVAVKEFVFAQVHDAMPCLMSS